MNHDESAVKKLLANSLSKYFKFFSDWTLKVLLQYCTAGRDNNAEGIVFRKRFNNQETFSGSWETSKSNLKTYFRNLEKNIFCSEIYDFVVFFS